MLWFSKAFDFNGRFFNRKHSMKTQLQTENENADTVQNNFRIPRVIVTNILQSQQSVKLKSWKLEDLQFI